MSAETIPIYVFAFFSAVLNFSNIFGLKKLNFIGLWEVQQLDTNSTNLMAINHWAINTQGLKSLP